MVFLRPAIAVQHTVQWILTSLNLYELWRCFGSRRKREHANVMQRRRQFRKYAYYVHNWRAHATYHTTHILWKDSRRDGDRLDCAREIFLFAEDDNGGCLYETSQIWLEHFGCCYCKWKILLQYFFAANLDANAVDTHLFWQSERWLANQFSLFHEFCSHRAIRTRFAFDSTLL